MTRATLIERILRAVYGEQPPDDASITDGLVNEWMNAGIGIAAKQNYKDAIQLDGVGYVNNSFYSTFKGIVPTQDEKYIWKVTLPQIPMGIGKNEGVRLLFKDDKNNVSYDAIPLSANQVGYYRSMRPIPNRILFYSEGGEAFAISTVNLTQYTATVVMISGGDSTDLSSTLNVPDDYIEIVTGYCIAKLREERGVPKNAANDGTDVA